MSRATRELGEQATRTLSGAWKDAVTDAERAGSYQLGDTIDEAVTAVTIPTAKPAWWQGVRLLQWLLLLISIAGIVWVIVGAFTGGIGTASVSVAAGGIVGSIIVCLIAGAARASGARRRSAEVDGELRAAVEKAAGSNFLAPVVEVLAEHEDAYRALRR